MCNSAVPGNNAAQPQYKFAIQRAVLTIYTKLLTSESELAYRELLHTRPMRAPYTLVQEKKLSVPEIKTTYSSEHVFTDNFPDLVIIGLVADEDFASYFNRNPLIFWDFCVNCLKLKRNCMPVPRYCYTPNFVGRRCIKN